jgi:hypothetical protein
MAYVLDEGAVVYSAGELRADEAQGQEARRRYEPGRNALKMTEWTPSPSS